MDREVSVTSGRLIFKYAMVPSQPDVPSKEKMKIHQSIPSADLVGYIESKGEILLEMRNVELNFEESNDPLRETTILKKMFH